MGAMGGFRRHPAALAVGGFLALALALGVGRFVYTPILPYMTAGLGLDKAEAGLIASANFLGYLLGALLAASAVLPGARRLWLLGALAASALTTAAMALPESLPPFLALRFAGGAASAVAMVFGSALVMDGLAAAGRSGWSAALYAGVGGGIALSALLVPAVAGGAGDWAPLWLASGALSLLLLLPAGWLLSAPAARRDGRGGGGAADGGGALGRWIAAYGLFGFGYVITATFISDIMRADPLLRPAEHLVWLAVGLAAMPSALFWTWAGRRFGNRRAFAAAALVEAAGVALSVLGGDVGLLLLAAGLLGGTFMGLTALGLIEAHACAAGDPRRALALATAAFGLGQMVGPLLAGLLHDLLGSHTPASLTAAGALLLAAALAALRRSAGGARAL